uniref:Aminopeptidase n=1 Tax=Acrobeloides nanus TaxID=290746 RepID=A0A914BVR6_9BILA
MHYKDCSFILSPGCFYDLKLTFASKSDEIIGQVRIEIQCKNVTSTIELSANPLFLTIHHATLEHRLTNATLNLGLPLVNWNLFTIEFRLDSNLTIGHVYYLSIWFNTKYSDDHLGLSRHFNKEYGTWINSLFEPYLIRRLLPCFDEPKWRSVFKLQLWLQGEFANKSYVALSNTNGVAELWNENLSIWTFEQTPPIPTYLFTIAVGKFRSVCEHRTEIGRDVCIWRFSLWKGWERVAKLIIEAMTRFQRAMTDYLLADPIARLHLLILPLKINGMENFGLLNIKETLWPVENDPKSFEVFSQTLFHEVAHQWFGNLVTMNWWSHIWLSESLTTFLSSPRPILFDSSRDLTTDALVSYKWASHVPTIVYNKGAAVIEMLDSIITENRMRRLLRSYIRMNEFGSADTEIFLSLLNQTMNDETSMAVKFLSAWLHQGSHPIVFIDYDPILKQFCLSQTPKMGSNDVRWSIPIWIECVYGTVAETLHWISPDSQLILDLNKVTLTNSTQAVAFNRNPSLMFKLEGQSIYAEYASGTSIAILIQMNVKEFDFIAELHQHLWLYQVFHGSRNRI